MYVIKFAREWDLWIHASVFVRNTSVITGTDGLTPTRYANRPNVVARCYNTQNQQTYAPNLITRLSEAR